MSLKKTLTFVCGQGTLRMLQLMTCLQEFTLSKEITTKASCTSPKIIPPYVPDLYYFLNFSCSLRSCVVGGRGDSRVQVVAGVAIGNFLGSPLNVTKSCFVDVAYIHFHP